MADSILTMCVLTACDYNEKSLENISSVTTNAGRHADAKVNRVLDRKSFSNLVYCLW